MIRWLTNEGKDLDWFGRCPTSSVGGVLRVPHVQTLVAYNGALASGVLCVLSLFNFLERRSGSALYVWWARLQNMREGVPRLPG
jgi:hypothetical protein